MKKNGIFTFITVLGMLFVLVTMFLTGIQIAVYGDPEYRFYRQEYEKYTVPQALDMKISDVMKVSDYMMAYLDGKEEKLSIEVRVDGKMQDFFNRQDREHMQDVKDLFEKGRKLRNYALVLAIVLLIAGNIKKEEKQRVWVRLTKGYVGALVITAVTGTGLVIACARDFTATFTKFHEIFFNNDLWEFDEATDYMIRMLPEGFFSDMALRITLVFGVSAAVLAVVFALGTYITKKN